MMLRSVLFLSYLFCFSKAGNAQNPNSILPAKTKTTVQLKTPVGVAGQANGVKMGAITVFVDTAIKVGPKNAYLSIDIKSIIGTTQTEILNGKNLFWIFDKTGKEIATTAKVLFRVKGAMEDNIVDMIVKVPFRQKADNKNLYTVRYRWESKDKSKSIDFLTTK